MKGKSYVEAIENVPASRVGSGKEGHRMRMMDDLTMEVQVERDPAGSSVELKIAATAGLDCCVIHLSREDARRLAALILFQAERLDRSRESWRPPHPALERRSA
jgi:hypothetical protein